MLIKQSIVITLGHLAKLLVPARSWSPGSPQHELITLDFQLDVVCEPNLIKQHLWDSDPLRVADLDQSCFDNSAHPGAFFLLCNYIVCTPGVYVKRGAGEPGSPTPPSRKLRLRLALAPRPLLQAQYRPNIVAQRPDGLHRCGGTREGGEHRDAIDDRGAADGHFVEETDFA